MPCSPFPPDDRSRPLLALADIIAAASEENSSQNRQSPPVVNDLINLAEERSSETPSEPEATVAIETHSVSAKDIRLNMPEADSPLEEDEDDLEPLPSDSEWLLESNNQKYAVHMDNQQTHYSTNEADPELSLLSFVDLGDGRFAFCPFLFFTITTANN